MRFAAGFVLLVGLAIAQSQLVVPQFNNLNAILSLVPQIQGFISQLDNVLPQLSSVLSSSELSSLKDKITQVVLSIASSHGGINAIKDKLRPILEQFLGTKPQGRIEIDAILQQVLNVAASALPGLLIGLLGKRESPSTIQLPMLGQQFQQFQSQFLNTILTAVSNHLTPNALGQQLEQLFSQFFPGVTQMRLDINWDSLAQQALNLGASLLPGLLIGLVGKRDIPAMDARGSLDDLLAFADKFQLESIFPMIQHLLNPATLQQLQSQLFNTMITAVGSNWNLNTIAQQLQQLFTQFVPGVAQMRVDWLQVGEQALNGIVQALPGIAIGLVSLLGKREADLTVNIRELLSTLTVDKLAQLVQTVLNVDQATIRNALAKLKQLLQQFFPQYLGRVNFDELATNLLNQLNGILPNLSATFLQTLVG
jgi:hypothetical protein